MGWLDNVQNAARSFTEQDALRRTGRAGPPETAAIEDRVREGALMKAILGPLAPVSALPVGAVGLGYEGAKALAQKSRLGGYLPGPFKVDETSSPASLDNALALMRGLTGSDKVR